MSLRNIRYALPRDVVHAKTIPQTNKKYPPLGARVFFVLFPKSWGLQVLTFEERAFLPRTNFDIVSPEYRENRFTEVELCSYHLQKTHPIIHNNAKVSAGYRYHAILFNPTAFWKRITVYQTACDQSRKL